MQLVKLIIEFLWKSYCMRIAKIIFLKTKTFKKRELSLSEIKTNQRGPGTETHAALFITALLQVEVKNYLLETSQGVRSREASTERLALARLPFRHQDQLNNCGLWGLEDRM